MFGLIRFVLFGLMIVLGIALAGAVCVYVYPSTRIPMIILSYAEIAFFMSPAFVCFRMFDNRFREIALGFLFLCVAVLAIFYGLNTYMLYLADTWDIKIAYTITQVIKTPIWIIDGIGEFFSALQDALFGPGSRPHPAPRTTPHIGPVPSDTTGTIVKGMLESVWSIVLGIVSTFVADAILRRSRQSG